MIPLSEKMKDRITYDEPVSDDEIEDWANEVAQLEDYKRLTEARLDRWSKDYHALKREVYTAPELLDVVRDCVNFLADLNSTSPFDAEYMVQRAKALHKRAYTAHSKAKGE